MPSQRQEGGESALLVQAGRDISIGVNYEETRQIALDVFNANFHRLSASAGEVAADRARLFVDDYLRAQSAKNPEAFEAAKDPAFQLSLFEAEKAYARTGDDALKDILVDVLVHRAQESSRNLIQIVLEEAISTAPKLTADQFDALSLVFILSYSVINVDSREAFLKAMEEFVRPFIAVSKQSTAYQHLEYANCGNVSFAGRQIGASFRNTYSGVFSKGFTQEQFAGSPIAAVPRITEHFQPCKRDDSKIQFRWMNSMMLNEVCAREGYDKTQEKALHDFDMGYAMTDAEIENELRNSAQWIATMLDFWKESAIKQFRLTSVGIALGHANIRRRTRQDFDLRSWLHEAELAC